MRISKTRWSLGLLGLLAVLPVVGLAQSDTSAPVGPAPTVASEPVHFSPGVRDVLKLLDAKVDPSVINSYIKSSTTAYNPTATEIIALKEQGVSDDIVMALLQRGAEVRTQLAHAAQAAPLAPPPNAAQPPYNPDYTASAQDSYPQAADYGSSYPYSYPYYSYPYYGYGGYPYWWWNTWYPYAYWPYYYHGYYAHHFHGNSFANHSHSVHGGSFAHGGFAHAGVAHTGFAHGAVAHAGFSGGGAMHGGGGFSGGGAMHGGGGFSGGHGGGGGGGHGGGGHR